MPETELLFLAVGLLISLIFTEFFGLTPGGFIVPGYLAFHLDQPEQSILFFSISLLTYFLIKGLSTKIFLYGRRQLVLSIFIGSLLSWSVFSIINMVSAYYGQRMDFLGFVIPGLLAHSMQNQGVVRVLSTTVTASVFIWLIVTVLQWIH